MAGLAAFGRRKNVSKQQMRWMHPGSVFATPPASCGDAADGIPGDHRSADDCPHGGQEQTCDDRYNKDVFGVMA
jgi:hypothetical protein